MLLSLRLPGMLAATILLSCGGQATPASEGPASNTAATQTNGAQIEGASAKAEAAPPPCMDNPWPKVPLYLRGSLNQWSVVDAAQLTYDCGRFILTTSVTGAVEFKIASADWANETTFGGGLEGVKVDVGLPLQIAAAPGPNLVITGTGLHTFTLDVRHSRTTPTLTVTHGTDVPPLDSGNPEPAISDNAIAMSLAYNSRDLAHKTPFGAVPAGSQVSFTLSGKQGGVTSATLVIERQTITGIQTEVTYTPVARIPMQRNPGESGREQWTASHSFADIGVYGYYFAAEIAGNEVLYANNDRPVPHSRLIGLDGIGTPTYRPRADRALRRFHQTVYAPDFKTPAWAKDAVYYYIFPDRFRNGSRLNDPKIGVDTYIASTPIEVHTSWLDSGPYRPGNADGSTTDDEEYNNDFYGGDLQGVIDRLDYIAALGANVIYMTPIFESPSNHKYDTADYLAVDNNFGNLQTFDRLIREAKARGIRVILDTSLNHCAADSKYMDRYGKFPTLGAFEKEAIQQDSPYYAWFAFKPDGAEADSKYDSWFGYATMPSLSESDSFRAFAYGDKDSVTRFWLRRGTGGWRMDVTPWVTDEFWRAWRSAVKAEAPDALTVAETWFDASKYLLGDTFDATMNYIFREAVLNFANGGSAKEALDLLELTREHYPPEAFAVAMNLLSTHDTPRSLHLFGYQAGETSAEVIAAAKQKLRLAMLVQAVYAGAPAIFYGDEVGMTGGPDPQNRGTYPWADRGGAPDRALLADIKAIFKMRRENPVLSRGSVEPLYADDHVLVFVREDKSTGKRALVALSNAAADRDVSIPVARTGLPAQSTLTNLLAPSERVAVSGDTITLRVPARYGAVYLTR